MVVAKCDHLLEAKCLVVMAIKYLPEGFANLYFSNILQYGCQNILVLQIISTENMTIITLR